MENKIIVEKGTFEYNDKEYSSYFIAGKIKGKDVKVALMVGQYSISFSAIPIKANLWLSRMN